jgi:hypothetical protein
MRKTNLTPKQQAGLAPLGSLLPRERRRFALIYAVRSGMGPGAVPAAQQLLGEMPPERIEAITPEEFLGRVRKAM